MMKSAINNYEEWLEIAKNFLLIRPLSFEVPKEALRKKRAAPRPSTAFYIFVFEAGEIDDV